MSLRNFEDEIEDEKRSGLYNIVAKAAVWGIPILIGFYQLIAMNYFILNPFSPLIFYSIAILIIYIFLKSISNIKYLYYSMKKDMIMLFSFSITIFSFLIVIFTYFKGDVSSEKLPILLILLIIISISLLYVSKIGIEQYKNEIIKNELFYLAAEKYKIP